MIHFPWVQKNFISIRNINSSSSHFPFIKFRDPNLQFQPFGFSNFVLLERTRSYANCSKVRINGMDSNIKDLHGQMVANYAFFLPYIKGEANSYFAFPTQAGTSSFTHSLSLPLHFHDQYRSYSPLDNATLFSLLNLNLCSSLQQPTQWRYSSCRSLGGLLSSRIRDFNFWVLNFPLHRRDQ